MSSTCQWSELDIGRLFSNWFNIFFYLIVFFQRTFCHLSNRAVHALITSSSHFCGPFFWSITSFHLLHPPYVSCHLYFNQSSSVQIYLGFLFHRTLTGWCFPMAELSGTSWQVSRILGEGAFGEWVELKKIIFGHSTIEVQLIFNFLLPLIQSSTSDQQQDQGSSGRQDYRPDRVQAQHGGHRKRGNYQILICQSSFDCSV